MCGPQPSTTTKANVVPQPRDAAQHHHHHNHSFPAHMIDMPELPPIGTATRADYCMCMLNTLKSYWYCLMPPLLSLFLPFPLPPSHPHPLLPLYVCSPLRLRTGL